MGNSNAKRKHILVVEDDAAIGDMLTMMLEIEGYRVTWVRSARGAMQLLRNGAPEQLTLAGAPDLVLLDLQLPDMHGTEMVRILNASGEQTPPVIVLSAGRNHTVEQAGFQIRAADVLVKPFEVQTLLERVTNILK